MAETIRDGTILNYAPWGGRCRAQWHDNDLWVLADGANADGSGTRVFKTVNGDGRRLVQGNTVVRILWDNTGSLEAYMPDHLQIAVRHGNTIYTFHVDPAPLDFVYFIYSNKMNNHVLAVNDQGGVTTTGNKVAEGWEGWLLEPAGDGVFFIVSNKHKNHVLAVNDQGGVTTTGNKVREGWEGFRVEYSGTENVYFIVRNKAPHYVLAVNDQGGITTTQNKVVKGWEGWVFEPHQLHDGPVYIVSQYNPKLVWDIEGGSMVNHGRVILWPYHGGANQQFKFDPKGFIYNVKSNLVCDIAGGFKAGSVLIQWGAHGGRHQLFRLHLDGTIRVSDDRTWLLEDKEQGSQVTVAQDDGKVEHHQQWKVVRQFRA